MRTLGNYKPFLSGKFEISAGLKLIKPPGKIFEIDDNYQAYIAEKQVARKENLSKYYPQGSRLSDDHSKQVCDYILSKLISEYPDLFDFNNNQFTNRKTGEMITINSFNDVDSNYYSYRDLFDAVCSQVQEDCSIWKIDGNEEYLASIHLCYPNHWNPTNKINENFSVVHAPVADFEKLNRAGFALLKQITNKGPFTRFAWGLATDKVLNHHPDNEFKGRSFNVLSPKLYARVERQTTSPFPELGLSLFTIKTYFVDCEKDLNQYEREQLISAIESMSLSSSQYKGISKTRDSIVEWLSSLN